MVGSGPLPGLVEVVAALERGGDVEPALQEVTDRALELFDADHASVRVCTDGAELRSVARSGAGAQAPAPSFRRGQGLLGWAVQTGEVVRVADSASDERFTAVVGRGFDVRSVMSIPLMLGDRVLGVFSVSAARPDAFSEVHEQLGRIVAHCVCQALRTAELEREATTDAMTRALNRSRLLPTLCSEMNRSRREQQPLSVLLMDLDHFKSVNDLHGHAVGDAVLSAFADVVRSCVRSFDVLIRRGGEEFELVMPGTSTVDGFTVAERIRSRLSSAPIQIKGLAIEQTVSIGLATWDGKESPETLDQRADAAMYAAKRRGRDRIIVAKAARISRSGSGLSACEGSEPISVAP